jgi:hypothetical protein
MLARVFYIGDDAIGDGAGETRMSIVTWQREGGGGDCRWWSS